MTDFGEWVPGGKDRKIYREKVKARLNRKCPGHWLNKKLGWKKNPRDIYENGVCVICGGRQPDENINSNS